MKPTPFQALFATVAMSLLFMACPQGNLDLAWEDETGLILPTPSDTIDLEGMLNVNDTVFVLPGDTLESVTWDMLNLGLADVSESHNIRFLLIRQLFLANLGTGQIGYEDNDTLMDELSPGPNPFAAGSSQPVTFNIDTVLECGLYKVIAIANGDAAFPDTNGINNTTEDWIFVESQQRFNLTRNTPRVIQHLESNGPAQPSHTFSITSGSPLTTSVLYTSFKVTPPSGSAVNSNPKPAFTYTTLPGLISTNVTPTIPPIDVVENKVAKVTCVSADGCILRQRSGLLEIIHDQ